MLHERIKKIRLEAGESQAAMGERLGIAQRTVAGWENGTRQPNADMLVKIAETYQVTTDYLLGRTNNPNFYVYEGIDAGDGRKGVLYSARKNLPPEEQEQVESELQYVLKNGPSVNLKDSNLTFDGLLTLIQQIVDQALEKRGQQDDG